MSGPGDGWPPAWDDQGDDPFDWAAGAEEHQPPDLPEEPLPPDPVADPLDPAATGADPTDPVSGDPAAGDPAAADQPPGLPPEPPADWSDPAGWTDEPQPYAAGGDDPFPPALEVGVTPADGGPWADPDLLGADTPLPPPEPVGDAPAALRADLAAAAGEPGADWAALRGSDDPAIRTLAALWQPRPQPAAGTVC